MSVQVCKVDNSLEEIYKFQYILCVGSSSIKGDYFALVAGFQYILCVGSSKKEVKAYAPVQRFQYILCVGSRLVLRAL